VLHEYALRLQHVACANPLLLLLLMLLLALLLLLLLAVPPSLMVSIMLVAALWKVSPYVETPHGCVPQTGAYPSPMSTGSMLTGSSISRK